MNVLAFPAKASLQKLKLFVKGEEKFLLLGDRIPGKCIHLSRVHLPRVALRMHFSFRKLSSDRHKQRRTESPRDGGRQAVQKLHCSEHRTVVGVVLVVVVFLVHRQVQGQLTSSQTAKWDCKNYSISSSSPKTKSSELQQSRTVQNIATLFYTLKWNENRNFGHENNPPPKALTNIKFYLATSSHFRPLMLLKICFGLSHSAAYIYFFEHHRLFFTVYLPRN